MKILLQVGDDGSVLAATEEDEVFQSLIGGQDNNGLSPLDPDVSDAVEDDEDKEGSDNLSDADGDDPSLRATAGELLHMTNVLLRRNSCRLGIIYKNNARIQSRLMLPKDVVVTIYILME